MSLPIVVAITGASGAVYATRLLQVLLSSGRDVHLTISPSGKSVLAHELGLSLDLAAVTPASLRLELAGAASEGKLHCHRHDDFFAPIASGSFLTGGMVVCPCSGGSLSAIATGASDNLIQRAADVHLKERRPLILVPRETPLSLVHLDNMRRAAEFGAIILPASPGWYHGVRSTQDLVDFIVARILDQLRVEHQLMRRWGE
jgi:4-hydroxy-3-polyprenylbenzoate decarboxylase